jgi:hypothetical protein
MIRLLSIFMLLVGFVWALAIAWAYVSLSGISVPVSMRVVILEYGAMLIPSAVMIIGSILILSGALLRPSAILICLACLMLTGIMAYQLVPDLHPAPLQMRPPYLLDVALIVLFVLIDLGAFRLYQLTSNLPAPGA